MDVIHLITANSHRAAVIPLNPGAMDQGILTVGRFDSGYRAGIVAYQCSSKPYFSKIRRDAGMLLIRIMMYLAIVSAAGIIICALIGGGKR